MNFQSLKLVPDSEISRGISGCVPWRGWLAGQGSSGPRLFLKEANLFGVSGPYFWADLINLRPSVGVIQMKGGRRGRGGALGKKGLRGMREGVAPGSDRVPRPRLAINHRPSFQRTEPIKSGVKLTG